MDLCCWKRPLYQLSHHHCPKKAILQKYERENVLDSLGGWPQREQPHPRLEKFRQATSFDSLSSSESSFGSIIFQKFTFALEFLAVVDAREESREFQ